MDDLDRVFHRLVSNIRHRFPEYLTMPFTVQELYESLIPYRHHRRELGIETNQDYEIAVTRLLSGERDYLQADEGMRDKLLSELGLPNGDPGAFREFANSKVSLAPEALRRIRALTASPAADASPPAAPVSQDAPGGQAPGLPSPRESAAGDQSAQASAPGSAGFSATFPVGQTPLPAPTTSGGSELAPSAISSLMNNSMPEGCRFCGGTLPEGRTVVYCPHCGHNLSVSRCPACGGELEKGWKFCATCGRGVG